MLLSVSRLTRKLESKTLFEAVSFELEAGTTLAVVGPSGSGKTSLLRCLACLDPFSEGELLLEGQPPAGVGFVVWRRSVCYVAQHPPLLRGSAREFAKQIESLEVQRDRETSSPFELAERWRLDAALWDREFSELSGGEKQRVLLALAVSRGPRLLVLDEPTSALDAETTKLVEQSLEGLSLVWVTHDVAQAERVAQRTLDLAS